MELEFEDDDCVFLKVYPMKEVLRFKEKGKLSPHYKGPHQILRRSRSVEYELAFPISLASVHPVFHVYILNKYDGDNSLVVPTEYTGLKNFCNMKKSC